MNAWIFKVLLLAIRPLSPEEIANRHHQLEVADVIAALFTLQRDGQVEHLDAGWMLTAQGAEQARSALPSLLLPDAMLV